MKQLNLCLLLLVGSIHLSYGANVLFFFALSTYSHRITAWPLAEELVAKGHSVTFIQPFVPKKISPKIKEFLPKDLLDRTTREWEQVNLLKVRLESGRAGIVALTAQLPEKGLELCSEFLQNPETQNWIMHSTFDLVIIDSLMNECGFGLAHKFKAKTIIFGTTHPLSWWFDPFGFLPETSWITEQLHFTYQYPMPFMGRFLSTMMPIMMYLQKQHSYYPKLDALLRDSLGLPDMPSVSTLERETSLIFTNTHYSEELARSLPPLVVSIGGIHCEDTSQKLTKELEKFLSGTDDFIYVSFGSAARISEAPFYFQEIFYKAMANTSMKFVWKFEGERNEHMPSNVFTAKWMPQQAILAHPKIKAFFTHGGLLGIQEAVWHGVPLLAMPLFAEQDYNALRVERTQRGIMLDPNEISLEKLTEALRDIVQNPIYKKNMAKLSIKFKDRPAKPLETALWWTEYVLRHDDLSDLKPLGMELTWFVRRSLDVWAFVFSILLVILLVVISVVRRVVVVFLCSSQPKKVKRQ